MKKKWVCLCCFPNSTKKIILKMKLLTLLLLVTVATVTANNSYSQQTKFSMKLENVTVGQVFDKIERTSEFIFIYSEKSVDVNRKVNVDVEDENVTSILDQLFNGTNNRYEIHDRQIMILSSDQKELKPLNKAENVTSEAQQPQKKTFSGVVKDSNGAALPGVSVVVKGTTTGTITDENGKFSFIIPFETKALVFSFVGMQAKELSIEGKSSIDVVLEENSQKLDEMVVVAFGKQKKTDMVGSVTSIKPADLKIPASNLTTALAGQASGVISYQLSGEPGQDNASFFIRGVTSFGTGKVDPLILIDGIELGVTELARLRPDDIESFSIFKDATSTALYGARGANGVIYISTKQGKEGKPRINFRAERSLSAPTKNIEFADPVTYMRQYSEAQYARDPFSIPRYSQEKIDRTEEGLHPIIFPATDWRKTLFKDNTINQRYNMSVSGGGKVASYYVAGSYSQDNGVLRVDKVNNFNNNIDLKSYTLRANVNIFLTPSTELIVRLNGNFDDYNGPIQGGGAIYNTVVKTSPVDFLPYYPVDDDHRYVQHVMFGGLKERAFLNPYADMVKGYKEYNRSLMLAQMEFKQNLSFITKGLTFRTMFNTNRISRFDIERAYKPFYYEMVGYDRKTYDYEISNFNETSGEEFLSFNINDNTREQNSDFYLESALNYSQTLNKKHSFNAMLVSIMRSSTNAQAGSLQLSLPSRNVGLSGRTTYSYDSRYFAEFNFGYNGSERFHESKRFGFFPSAGLAWTISNEKSWEPLKKVINNLRVRLTYGLVGNDAIGSSTDRFFYLSNVDMNNSSRSATFGRESKYTLSGINVTRYANPDITWETSQKGNLALELGLFGKVNVMADLFKERRTNILMTRASIPETMGLTANVRANIGEASAEGLDISMDLSHHFTNDFWLQVRGNFTYATNKYEVYEEPSYEKEWWKSRIGYPISQPWGYIAERLFVDDNEVANSPVQNFGSMANIAGDIKYKDVNKDGQITSLDMVPIGYPTVPEINYGAGFSLGYKRFDISAFFQGSARSSFWTGGSDGPSAVQPFVGGNQILKVFADSHYSLENPDLYALWPRLSTLTQSNNMQRSTWWLNDGTFLRLKQAEIGWSLPERIAKKMSMQNMRVYVSGTNLLLFSKFKLWDVEMGGNGLGYPLQRVYNMGINLTF